MFWRLNAFIILCAMVFGAGVIAAPSGGDSPDNAAMDSAIISLSMADDIYAGPESSYPEQLAVFNGDLYFRANGSSATGSELWKYNSTHGAVLVQDLSVGSPSSSPMYLTSYAGSLYFSANLSTWYNRELYRYNPGTGVMLVANINTSGSSNPSYLTVFGDYLYFSADGNNGNGTELWRYSPATGVQPVADINSGIGSSYPGFLSVYNGALFFSANDATSDEELWKFTPASGAQRVEDINTGTQDSDPHYLAVYNGALYFNADGGDGAGHELWKYDPINGAQRVADICNGFRYSSPQYLIVYNGALYFGANGCDSAGYELWKYDPVNGPVRVTDIYPGDRDGSISSLAVYNGILYFRAKGDNGYGYELWKYGNSAGSSFRSVRGADGWVLESGETTNTGGTVNAGAATFNLGDDAADRQYRSILSFDTSSLPDTAVVTNVRLRIRREGLAGTNHFATLGNIKVDIRNGPFGGNVTLQPVDFQSAASKTAIGTITSQADANNWYTAALTSASYPSVNRKGVTQIRLRFATDDNNDNGADYLRFFSGNAALFTNRPELQVTYYTP